MSVAFEQMPRLYLSSPETSDEPTSIDMIESSDTLALTQTDSDWETVVGLTADADADANSVVVGSFPLPHPNPAARRRHSFPNLRTDAPSQRSRSSRRASVSGEQTARLYLSKPESPDHHTSVDGADSFNARPPIQVDLDSEAKVASTADANAKSAEASEVPLPRLKAATRRRHSCPDLRIYFSHAPSQQFHSSRRVSIAVEQMPRLYLTRPRHAPQHLVDNEIEREAKEEVKFKFRRGGKRNTARKHRRQMQDQDQGNPGAGPSSAN
ncbi:hypothetical protein FRC00_004414 [Tulasnella sp. 408]|nr:hypothetical protein FRC00_004414 [Tulasnella sp. 408]